MEVIKFEDGGWREDILGKGSYKDIPAEALQRVSHRYQYGQMKYGVTDNYKKGLPVSNCWDSAMRHMIAYKAGDNSEDHLASVVWNVFAIIEMELHNPKYCDIEVRKDLPCTPEFYRDQAIEKFRKKENL